MLEIVNEILVDAAAEGTLVELRQRSEQRKVHQLLLFYETELARVGRDRARAAGILPLPVRTVFSL